MLLEGAESGLSPGSAPFIKQPNFCTTVRQTETNELNTLVNLLVAKRGCRNQGSDSGNQSKRATDKSEAVAGLEQVALVGAVAVSGVGVCVRIGRGVSAVAPVFASAGLGLSLPACIQGELGLSAVHSGVEVIGRGAVLVAEPTREDIASRDCGSISVPTLADLEGGGGHAQPLPVVGESLVEAPPSLAEQPIRSHLVATCRCACRGLVRRSRTRACRSSPWTRRPPGRRRRTSRTGGTS